VASTPGRVIGAGQKPASSRSEVGFGDLRASGAAGYRLLGKVRELSRRSDLSPGQMPKSGREQDSLISAEISLIARYNSLQGRKKFPVRMRRELTRKQLMSLPFSRP
jgi:hypothetical protein